MALTFTDPTIEMHAFLVTAWTRTPENLEPAEHDQLGWFTATEIEHLVIADPASRGDLIAATRR